MAATYELYLTSDTGRRIQLLSTVNWFNCSRVANGIGTLTACVEVDFNPNLLKRDYMIQVWRAPEGGRLSLWRVYFVTGWQYANAMSTEQLLIYGVDSNAILTWRVVAYYSGEEETRKTESAGDMAKELVEENLGGSAVTDRDLSSYVSIQTDLSDGETITELEVAWRNLYDCVVDICQASKEAGTLLYFDMAPDVIKSTSISFMFVTKEEQPGADRTADGFKQLVFSQRYGTLKNAVYEEDYSDEKTYVYAGGQGELDYKNVQEKEATKRSGLSVWGRKEDYINASDQVEDDGVIARARDRLRSKRPKIRFSGMITDTEGVQFGRDWFFGDKVIAKYKNLEFNCIISTVSITVRNKFEHVTARLEYEE